MFLPPLPPGVRKKGPGRHFLMEIDDLGPISARIRGIILSSIFIWTSSAAGFWLCLDLFLTLFLAPPTSPGGSRGAGLHQGFVCHQTYRARMLASSGARLALVCWCTGARLALVCWCIGGYILSMLSHGARLALACWCIGGYIIHVAPRSSTCTCVHVATCFAFGPLSRLCWGPLAGIAFRFADNALHACPLKCSCVFVAHWGRDGKVGCRIGYSGTCGEKVATCGASIFRRKSPSSQFSTRLCHPGPDERGI